VIGILFATYKYNVADLKIAELRRLSLFPELRALADLDGYRVPALSGNLDGLLVHRRQFTEQARTPVAAAARSLLRTGAL
jgi:hypothetical protein